MNIPRNAKISVSQYREGVGVSLEIEGPSPEIGTTEQLWDFFNLLSVEARKRAGWDPGPKRQGRSAPENEGAGL